MMLRWGLSRASDVEIILFIFVFSNIIINIMKNKNMFLKVVRHLLWS